MQQASVRMTPKQKGSRNRNASKLSRIGSKMGKKFVALAMNLRRARNATLLRIDQRSRGEKLSRLLVVNYALGYHVFLFHISPE